jgi:hypothetical protein
MSQSRESEESLRVTEREQASFKACTVTGRFRLDISWSAFGVRVRSGTVGLEKKRGSILKHRVDDWNWACSALVGPEFAFMYCAGSAFSLSKLTYREEMLIREMAAACCR